MNIAHGPKIRTLTTNESVSSLEAWKSNILYGLRLNEDFREYLEENFVFGRKTKASPSRRLVDICRKEKVKEGDPPTEREILVIVKSKEERSVEVELLLEQIANYCPHVPRSDLVKDCGSLKEVWKTIRSFYNKQLTGSSLNNIWNIRRELDETPQALYARIKQLYIDNLLTTDGLTHVDGKVDEDEELSPTLLNTIILHWLQLLHPGLRDIVTQRFLIQLCEHTYARVI